MMEMNQQGGAAGAVSGPDMWRAVGLGGGRTCRSSEVLSRGVTRGSGCVETDLGGDTGSGRKLGLQISRAQASGGSDGLLADRGQCRWHH